MTENPAATQHEPDEVPAPSAAGPDDVTSSTTSAVDSAAESTVVTPARSIDASPARIAATPCSSSVAAFSLVIDVTSSFTRYAFLPSPPWRLRSLSDLIRPSMPFWLISLANEFL